MKQEARHEKSREHKAINSIVLNWFCNKPGQDQDHAKIAKEANKAKEPKEGHVHKGHVSGSGGMDK
jgi:hypothetical protein